jgi:hypothetical protein
MKTFSVDAVRLSQVSVAVLLDNFVSASARINEEEKRIEREHWRRLQQVQSKITLLRD